MDKKNHDPSQGNWDAFENVFPTLKNILLLQQQQFFSKLGEKNTLTQTTKPYK